MEMRKKGDVPGGTGQGACEETGRIADELDDDKFDNFQGEPGGRRRVCRRSLRMSTPKARSLDSGWVLMPNPFGE